MIRVEPFQFNTKTLEEPSLFEITLILKETKYRYGFKIKKQEVIEEWLFYTDQNIRENYLFIRNAQDFKISKTWNKESGNKVENQGLPFAKQGVLLLTVLASLSGIPRISEVFNWIKGNIVISKHNSPILMRDASNIYSIPDNRTTIRNFLDNADLGFTNIFDKIAKSLERDPDQSESFLHLVHSDAVNDFKLFVTHYVYNAEHEQVDIATTELLKTESSGTIKYFTMVAYLTHAIKQGQLIWIDELDSSLHTDLLIALVTGFNSAKINPNAAQLIYTTHNTGLMDKKIRRDQIVFVNKNKYGESMLEKMHNKTRPIRIDKSVEKEYREGKLGGVSKTNPGTLFD